MQTKQKQISHLMLRPHFALSCELGDILQNTIKYINNQTSQGHLVSSRALYA